MVLRLHLKGACVETFDNVDRVVYNELNNIEVRFEVVGTYQWKTYKRGFDWDSFTIVN